MQGSDIVVRVLSVEKRRNFLWEKREAPNLNSFEKAFKLGSQTAGGGGAQQIDSENLLSAMLSNQEDRIVAVNTSPIDVELVFPKAFSDKEGFPYDLKMKGRLSISDCKAFLENLAKKIMLSSGLVSGDLEAYLVMLISQQIREEVRSHKDALNSDIENALPVTHWSNRIFAWLAERYTGLTGFIAHVHWSSEDKKQSEIAKTNAQMIASRQEKEKQLLQEQAEITRLRAERDKQLSDIQFAKDLDETAKRIKKDQLIKNAELEIKTIEKRMNSIEREEELEQARVRLEVAKLLEDVKQIEDAKAKAQATKKREDEIQDKFSVAVEELTKLLKQEGTRLPDPTSKDSNAEYKATSHVNTAVLPDAFNIMDFKSSIWMSIDFFKGKARIDGKVKLTKTQSKFRERTIVATKREVPTLREGESLAFSIHTKRSGFMTLLNIGTSGEIYIHVPSSLLKGGKGYVSSGKEYEIPGPELFPWDYLYIEGGPTGWEHMVAFVSEQPLIEESILARSSEDDPLVKLTQAEYEALMKKLTEEIPSDDWSVCIESFLVVDRSASKFLN